MADALVKYVFLDIVEYTKDRTVEAQSDIVRQLNRIVRQSLKEQKVTRSETILIPTGDGMCIALVDKLRPWDVHLKIALKILAHLDAHNAATSDSTRKFQLRIGLNEHTRSEERRV